MRSTTENQLLWEQRIDERTKSGMTIEEWCKKKELSRHMYHYWNHRLKKKQKPDKEVMFAEITPILSNTENVISNPEKSDDFQVFFKNMQVTVPSNFNPSSLSELIKVLKEL